MQLINAPGKLTLPFANAGGKNTIPAASQIGITPGAASLVDGFPPLTRTPLAAGGVPPSGLDMNGVLFELSAIARWLAAGGSFTYDGTFAADADVAGYPAGAVLLRSDGDGFWFNLTDGNVTNPEAAGAAAAGWVPMGTNGAAAITMTNANVTLTPLQYGRPVVVITGALAANLELIFPAIVNGWTVINATTGAYSITAKTAAGSGVVVRGADTLICDGTNVRSVSRTDFDVTVSVQQALEKVTIGTGFPAATQHFDWLTQAVQLFTGTPVNHWTLNVRGNASTTLNSQMRIGQSATICVKVTMGATPYYANSFTIDSGAPITPKWVGGTVPSSGDASCLNIYTYTITKTADATFVVEASKVKTS